jgi:hypothetical protein
MQPIRQPAGADAGLFGGALTSLVIIRAVCVRPASYGTECDAAAACVLLAQDAEAVARALTQDATVSTRAFFEARRWRRTHALPARARAIRFLYCL